MATAKTKSSFFFITGSDEAGVKKAAAELAEKLSPGADAFGRETIDGMAESTDAAVACIEQTIESLLTIPFLGGAKLVWLKNATFLADGVTGRSESITAALERLCAVLQPGLPDDVKFLLSAPEADKRRAAYKSFVKLGDVTLKDKPDFGFNKSEEDIIGWTAERVHARGLKISHDAVETLAARVGAEARQLDSELDKLDISFGEAHAITAEDIRILVPATRESGIFDLGNAIAKRDLHLALETLTQLLLQNERAVGILLASIAPTVKNLLFVKDLIVRHKLPPPAQPHFFAGTLKRLPESALSHLPRKKDGTLNSYPLGIAAMNCSHYTLAELQAGYVSCAEANLHLITSQTDEDVVLTQLLIKLMAKK